VLQSLAILALKQGDLTSARAHIEESLDLTPNVERDARASHASLNLLGLLELFDGNIPTARDVYRELLVVAHRLGVQPFIAYAFLGLGFCAGALGDFSRAIRIHGAADQLFERIGERLEPDLEAYRQHEHRRLRRMVAEDFEALYLEGRGLATRDTIVLAMNE
jgi:tetratricopeptide (TPR) repeat protein